MTDKPERPPTDAAIIKGFEKLEQGFNVAISYFRTHPLDDAHLHYAHQIDTLWESHRVYREIAVAAQKRIDDKREAKENERHDAG